MTDVHDFKDPRVLAAIDLIRRTGAKHFQIRYSDDPEPTVWVADAVWPFGSECAAAMTPERAVMRLLDQVVDGGTCAHCGKPCGVTIDWETAMPTPIIEGRSLEICWFVYDPETKSFRRLVRRRDDWPRVRHGP